MFSKPANDNYDESEFAAVDDYLIGLINRAKNQN